MKPGWLQVQKSFSGRENCACLNGSWTKTHKHRQCSECRQHSSMARVVYEVLFTIGLVFALEFWSCDRRWDKFGSNGQKNTMPDEVVLDHVLKCMMAKGWPIRIGRVCPLIGIKHIVWLEVLLWNPPVFIPSDKAYFVFNLFMVWWDATVKYVLHLILSVTKGIEASRSWNIVIFANRKEGIWGEVNNNLVYSLPSGQ